jgi:hypothetical protein
VKGAKKPVFASALQLVNGELRGRRRGFASARCSLLSFSFMTDRKKSDF